MRPKVIIRTLLILFMLALNIGCDQVSKSIVRKKVSVFDQINLWNNHLHIVKVENTGAFLSAGDSLSRPEKMIFLNLLPLAAVLFGLIFMLTKTDLSPLTLFGVILVVGGGTGNLYDRIMHGSVTDFLHLKFGVFQTGIFNVADMSITAGVLIILAGNLFPGKKAYEGSNLEKA